MSHYIYKKKQFIKCGESILPLVKRAHSSVRFNGGGFDYYWEHLNITEHNGLLIPKELWDKEREAIVQREFQQLSCYYEQQKKFWSPAFMPDDLKRLEHPDMECTNFSGAQFPSGRKIKNMYAFLSTKRLLSMEDFLERNMGGFFIRLYSFEKYALSESFHTQIIVNKESDIFDAEREYQNLCNMHHDYRDIVIKFSQIRI